MILTKTT